VTRWLTDDEQATWRAFETAARLIDAELDGQLVRDSQMTHSHYAILVSLSEAPDGRVRMGELAQRLRYSASRMSHAITRMERSGWARRQKCPDDGRGQEAVITDAGRRVLVDAAPGHVGEVRRLLFDRLSEADQHRLREICERLLVAHD